MTVEERKQREFFYAKFDEMNGMYYDALNREMTDPIALYYCMNLFDQALCEEYQIPKKEWFLAGEGYAHRIECFRRLMEEGEYGRQWTPEQVDTLNRDVRETAALFSPERMQAEINAHAREMEKKYGTGIWQDPTEQEEPER